MTSTPQQLGAQLALIDAGSGVWHAAEAFSGNGDDVGPERLKNLLEHIEWFNECLAHYRETCLKKKAGGRA